MSFWGNNKIFFISLTLSVGIHTGLLFGLSDIGGLRFLHPDSFNAVFVNLEEVPAARQDSAKSTAYNLLKNFPGKNGPKEENIQESKRDLSPREDREQITGDTEKDGSKDGIGVTQTVADVKGIQQGPLQTEARRAETIVKNEEPVSGDSADKGKDKTAYVKTAGPSGKTEPPSQTLKAMKEAFSYDIFWLGIYVG
jgi:hypothetical protein